MRLMALLCALGLVVCSSAQSQPAYSLTAGSTLSGPIRVAQGAYSYGDEVPVPEFVANEQDLYNQYVNYIGEMRGQAFGSSPRRKIKIDEAIARADQAYRRVVKEQDKRYRQQQANQKQAEDDLARRRTEAGIPDAFGNFEYARIKLSSETWAVALRSRGCEVGSRQVYREKSASGVLVFESYRIAGYPCEDGRSIGIVAVNFENKDDYVTATFQSEKGLKAFIKRVVWDVNNQK